MSELELAERVLPFESASELRQVHTHLLEQLDQELAHDSSESGEASAIARLEPQIRIFLRRGAATGVFLEEIKERTACTVLLEYWVSSLSQAGLKGAGVRLAHFDGQQLPDLNDKKCPYVGLEAFRGEPFFFGREADTAKLAAQVRTTPLVVVMGASGSGKSSLVMGGVLPALEQDGPLSWRILSPFVPGNAVLDHLAAALLGINGGAGVAAEVARLRKNSPDSADRLAAAGPPTVITIDQFEEVFTLSEAADRDTLVSSLSRLLESGAGNRVILTMREEFRSRMVELLALAPYLDKAWYSMRPMGYDELRAAVEKPAVLVNLQFQSGICDDLVKKVLGQPAALPLLQFTLRALWEARDRNRITWEVYRTVGDPLNALKTSADQFYDALTPETQDEVRRVLLELVRVDELLEAYRQPVPRGRFLEAGKANTAEVLDLLAKHDYIRITSDTGDSDIVVEVKHESLVRNWPRYVGWIDEKRLERRQRLAVKQAAERWARSGRPKEGLLTRWQLEEAKRHADLSTLENEFVQASAEEVDRGTREREDARVRQRLRSAALAGAITIAALIGIVSVYFWRKADSLQLDKVKLDEKTEQLSSLAQALEAKRVELEKGFAGLQATYNGLYAKRTEAPAGPGIRPAPQQVRVFLHISDESQRSQAQMVAQKLDAQKFKVPGIEKVPEVSQSDVRYFRPADQQCAAQIATYLNQSLGVKAPITPKLLRGFEDKVPPRQFEVWFTPDALSAPLADDRGKTAVCAN